jgi:hypothetical protein
MEAVPREPNIFLDGCCLVGWLGLAKALGFLAGYVFISLSAYHRCKGAIRIVYLGPPFQIFC